MNIIIKSKNKKYIIKIDPEDIGTLKDKNIWLAFRDNKPMSVRVADRGDKKGTILSRYLLNPPKNMVVDHINRNPLDNRRENMRICTQMENTRNKTKQSNNTSGIPSVEWQKDANMWRVRVKYLGNKIHIGYFKNKLEAGYVRDQVIMQLHGEYAKTYII